MSQYINEAFKQFRMLNESEDFTLDPMGLDNLGSFMDRAMEDADDIEIDITDIDADTEDELKKSYVGKVICECNVCHSNIFYDKADINVDEEGIVNMEDECPYCMSNDGYTIVGEIKPYEESTEDEVEEPEPEAEVDLDVEVEDPTSEEPIEVEEEKVEESLEDEDENLEEGLQLSGEKELKGTSDLRHREDKDGVEAIKGKNNSEISGDLDLHESIDEEELPKEDDLNECAEKEDETLTEDVEHIQLNSEDSTIDIGQKDDGGIVIETSPALEDEEPVDDVNMMSDDEVIAPLDDDTTDDLGLEDEPAFDDSDDLDLDLEDNSEDEDSEDVDVDEFDEDSFDGLGESYLRRCYENVNGFKTTKVTCNENKLMVEGNISFKSGNTKKTNFIFEAKETSNGKYMFEGYNEQINIGKNAFKLNCSLDNKKLISESLAYNYSSKNELNESVKLSGTVKSHRKAK